MIRGKGWKLFGFVVAAVLLLSCVSANAQVVGQKHAVYTIPDSVLAGKTLSILGDSISTFANYSNGDAAKTTNSTIKDGAIYYPRSGFDVVAESTWWHQAATALGMRILVNNSWSGSCLLNERQGTVGAYVQRCVQLHDDTGDNAGEKPNIIAVYLGTNDYYSYPGTLGSFEAIDFGKLIRYEAGDVVYAEPATTLEAYAITLHKIVKAYPDAQVYCFTLLPRVNSTNQPVVFNADICRLAQYFGVYTVDLYNCGISSDSAAFYKLMGDNLHPADPGMDAITNVFVSALLKNNGVDTYDVVFSLENVVAMEGIGRTVVSGCAFETRLVPLDASRPLDITVTMGGVDITQSCVNGNQITIPAVTAEVVITAKPGQREPRSFRWETRGNALVSVTDDCNTENTLTMTHGSITDGVYSKARFTMSQGICLRHDLPWCVEWKSSGTWTDTTDGALLFAQSNASATVDSCYFYRRHKNEFFAIGTYTGGKYHNYGVAFAGTGIDTTAEHVFRLENRIAADGSNMVWLLVDGVEAGPMNHHWVGGTDQKETVNWVCGKDFTFSYMGTNPHTIGGCDLEYIQVWENYHTHVYEAVVTAPTYTEQGYTTYTCECGDSYVGDYTDPIRLDSYRWEMENNVLVSMTEHGNTSNVLTMNSGSVANGTLSNARYTLQTAVRLYHDAPWVIEWRSSGNWSGMLFGSCLQSPAKGMIYLFRDTGTGLFAFGEYTGSWNNYGMILNCDMTVSHLFRLENRIEADGSNGVYLLVDGREVGAMDHYYIIGKDQNRTVNWANGKDITFSNIGTSSHAVSGMKLESLQVWQSGHCHEYQSAVTEPTCTEKGFTTYTCACGDSYGTNDVDALGHTYKNGYCVTCGAAAPGPYAGKTIACIGDSITAGVGVTKDKTDYVTLLAQSLGMNYIRLGASGSTLCTDGHATCNIGKLTEQNIAGADVVTILMGINDFVQARNGYYTLGSVESLDTSTVYGAVHMWCQRITALRRKDSMKNTEFFFMTPVITSWNNSVSSVRNWDQSKKNVHGYTLRDLCNAIIEVCALYDIPVIDLNLTSGLYYNSVEDHSIAQFGGDGAHPGDIGHQMMAEAIRNALLRNELNHDHDHSYGSWITTTYPDCDSGMEQRVCTICKATEKRMLDGKGHAYENGVCNRCGVRQTSTFRLLDTRSNQVEIFCYEVGMTWKQWLNSKYNTGMGSSIAIDVSIGPDILGGNPYADIFVNGGPADYDDVICESDDIELVWCR